MSAPASARGIPIARLVRRGGWVLAGVGLILLVACAYQLWGTGVQESRAQSQLRRDFELLIDAASSGSELTSTVTESPSATDPVADSPGATADPADSEPLARELITDLGTANGPSRSRAPTPDQSFAPDDSDAIARIEIASIDVDKIVVQGVRVDDLQRGPGHYSSTAEPGRGGNVAFAGHRTTYGAPFADIDQVSPGDEIVITTVDGEFVYMVEDPRDAFSTRLGDLLSVGEGHVIVDPEASWVLHDFGDNRLTLTACHPKFSDRERIIVVAELIGVPLAPPPPVGTATTSGDG